jgi:hypothetical protein
MTRGSCARCEAVYTKAGMGRHLQTCLTPAQPGGQAGLLFAIEGYRMSDYWLYVATSATATWADLDEFLRDIWVECCGHLSEFELRGIHFGSPGLEGMADRAMSSAMGRAVAPGDRFRYRYDSGTTTELALRAVMAVDSPRGSRRVQLVARNDPPVIACGACGRPATAVCAECRHEDGGWLCGECAAGHPCGDDYLLPVVNSPRVGLCDYTGG